MRAVAVRRGDRLEHQQLARDIALVQEREGGVQAEGAVERERAIGGARSGYRQLTMQFCIVRVGVGRHRRQTIQRTAQYHHHQACAAAGMGEQHARKGGARRQCAAAHQKAAPSKSPMPVAHPYLR